MKKYIIMALCAMFCLCLAAQNNEGSEDLVTSSEFNEKLDEITSLINQIKEKDADVAPKDIYVPLRRRKFLKNHLIYQTLDICPTISTDKVKNDDMSGVFDAESNRKNTEATQWGLNFGYSLLGVPGKIEGEQLKLNHLGFAYNIGFVAGFTKSSRYETVCDFLLKVGVELGNSHKMGIGIDALWGYGKGVGDVYFYNNITEDTTPTKIVPYTEWCWEKGAQIWMRSNLFGTHLQNTEVLVFARMMFSKDPEIMSKASSFHYNLWKEETWSFGVIFRKKF